MSYIPNKPMPHAAPNTDDEDDFENSGFYEWDEGNLSVTERMGELARNNPKTAIGAGVALIAGAIAGLAWPFVKSRSSAAPQRKKAARGTGGKAKAKRSADPKAKTASSGREKKKGKAAGKSRTAAKAPSTSGAVKPSKRTSAKGSAGISADKDAAPSA